MDAQLLQLPLQFLRFMLGDLPKLEAFQDLETWWETRGKAISADVDSHG